jgi:hypothetical protein
MTCGIFTSFSAAFLYRFFLVSFVYFFPETQTTPLSSPSCAPLFFLLLFYKNVFVCLSCLFPLSKTPPFSSLRKTKRERKRRRREVGFVVIHTSRLER